MLKKSLHKSIARLSLLLSSLAISSLAFAAVDVNKASEADLDGIKGIGPATTRSILSERKKSEFKNWEDLMSRVKGIGESRAQKLSASGLTVSGTPYRTDGVAANTKGEKLVVRNDKLRSDKSVSNATKAKEAGEEKK